MVQKSSFSKGVHVLRSVIYLTGNKAGYHDRKEYHYCCSNKDIKTVTELVKQQRSEEI